MGLKEALRDTQPRVVVSVNERAQAQAMTGAPGPVLEPAKVERKVKPVEREPQSTPATMTEPEPQSQSQATSESEPKPEPAPAPEAPAPGPMSEPKPDTPSLNSDPTPTPSPNARPFPTRTNSADSSPAESISVPATPPATPMTPTTPAAASGAVRVLHTSQLATVLEVDHALASVSERTGAAPGEREPATPPATPMTPMTPGVGSGPVRGGSRGWRASVVIPPVLEWGSVEEKENGEVGSEGKSAPGVEGEASVNGVSEAGEGEEKVASGDKAIEGVAAKHEDKAMPINSDANTMVDNKADPKAEATTQDATGEATTSAPKTSSAEAAATKTSLDTHDLDLDDLKSAADDDAASDAIVTKAVLVRPATAARRKSVAMTVAIDELRSAMSEPLPIRTRTKSMGFMPVSSNGNGGAGPRMVEVGGDRSGSTSSLSRLAHAGGANPLKGAAVAAVVSEEREVGWKAPHVLSMAEVGERARARRSRYGLPGVGVGAGVGTAGAGAA